MKNNSENNLIETLNIISLILIFVAEICFYTIEKMNLYTIMTGLGIFVSLAVNTGRKIKVTKFEAWISLCFIMFMIYGVFFLRKGDFDAFKMFFRYLEIISIYKSIKRIMNCNISMIYKPFVISGIISAFYLLIVEGVNIVNGSIRVGDLLSGNVNTVGYNFGIMATMTICWYCHEKKLYKFLLYLFFTFIMLITGSKKIIIIVIFDLLILFYNDKNKINRWAKLLFCLIVFWYLIMNIPYLYNIIGIRVESMLGFLSHDSSVYSYSTDVREGMIKEGIRIFLNNPIFGGGWNTFYDSTTYLYSYSHNNYIEVLCSFGIIGFIIFYYKHLSNIITLIKNSKDKNSKHHIWITISLLLTIMALLLDYSAVTFSSQVLWYMPVIISSIVLEIFLNTKKEIEHEKD